MAKPPEIKNFSVSPPLCTTLTIPGANWDIIGEIPAVTPYSPFSPGILTDSTTLSEYIGSI